MYNKTKYVALHMFELLYSFTLKLCTSSFNCVPLQHYKNTNNNKLTNDKQYVLKKFFQKLKVKSVISMTRHKYLYQSVLYYMSIYSLTAGCIVHLLCRCCYSICVCFYNIYKSLLVFSFYVHKYIK